MPRGTTDEEQKDTTENGQVKKGRASGKPKSKAKGGRPKLDPGTHRVQRTITLAPDMDARATRRMVETGLSLAQIIEESLRQTLPPYPHTENPQGTGDPRFDALLGKLETILGGLTPTTKSKTTTKKRR